ncbi:WecB/TagA/CpsF family glycosyltransferase [Paenibacillus physcomitrellae]|uniref:WecB/TagA/CpsF family glycosyltransferase n=1 Tax=Paenibacillus physcomitrellae TaxID=1619311 RepID=UPI001E3B723E|nr:WecB/TagA/CpsF family glycosyltransferase [Paenibacillus physcomitrellae]
MPNHSVPNNSVPNEAVPTVDLFGIRVSKWGMDDTVRYLAQAIESGTPHQVITANPIMVMAALEDPSYMEIMKKAELIVPDGTGVVWAAGKAGNPVKERVAGFDLLHELMKLGEQRAWKFYLLGSSPEVIQAAKDRLQMLYPGVKIVGWRDGYFKSEQDQEVVEAIQAAAPDVLFVARGADTQEPWIAKYKQQLAVPVMMGVGGSFDVISGRSKRAPKWMQKLRAEWLYRLIKEPTRYRRMLALPKFAVKVLREKENLG